MDSLIQQNASLHVTIKHVVEAIEAEQGAFAD